MDKSPSELQECILPKALMPKRSQNLMRIGSESDGGYLVSELDVIMSSSILSGGINDDWSFEEHFLSIKDMPLFAYDPTISEKKFKQKLFSAQFKIGNRTEQKNRRKRTLDSYREFFRGSRVHIKKFVGGKIGENYISIEGMISESGANKHNPAFLKLDIEGSEYDCLNSIVSNSSVFTGIVIEFHDVAENLEAILNFVERLDHDIVHVHVNNYAGCEKNQIPEVIEVTFSDMKKNPLMPHSLDFPNDPNRLDVSIRYSKT